MHETDHTLYPVMELALGSTSVLRFQIGVLSLMQYRSKLSHCFARHSDFVLDDQPGDPLVIAFSSNPCFQFIDDKTLVMDNYPHAMKKIPNLRAKFAGS
jgi:hypothetical protein